MQGFVFGATVAVLVGVGSNKLLQSAMTSGTATMFATFLACLSYVAVLTYLRKE